MQDNFELYPCFRLENLVKHPVKDNRGRTALHLGFQHLDGYTFSMVRTLIKEHDSDIHAEDNRGLTPVDHFLRNILRINYYQNIGRMTLTRSLPQFFDFLAKEKNLDFGAIKSKDGKNFLHAIFATGFPFGEMLYDLARCLVTLGVSPKDSSDDGITPLHQYIISVINYERDDLTTLCGQFATPLEIINLLVASGAPLLGKEAINESTILHSAVLIKNGYNECSTLLSHGAKEDINARDKMGQTPLMILAKAGPKRLENSEVVSFKML